MKKHVCKKIGNGQRHHCSLLKYNKSTNVLTNTQIFEYMEQYEYVSPIAGNVAIQPLRKSMAMSKNKIKHAIIR